MHGAVIRPPVPRARGDTAGPDRDRGPVRSRPADRTAEARPGIPSVLALQRAAGNHAVTAVLARERAPAGPTAGPGLEPPARCPRVGPVAALRTASLPSLAQLAASALRSRSNEPTEVPGGSVPPYRRTTLLIGPVDGADARTALSGAGAGRAMVARVPTGPDLGPLWQVAIVYLNDGRGNIVNTGTGGDQGLTAGLAVIVSKLRGAGFTGFGVHHEMRTPRGTLPEGTPDDPTPTYDVAGSGPWAGIVAVDVEYTIERSGRSSLAVFASVGIDSHRVAQAIQDAVHENLS